MRVTDSYVSGNGTEHDPDALSVAFEARLTREERRRLGVFNTPWSVATQLAVVIDRPGVVCDPSVGTGTLLLAAGERLVELGLSRAGAARLLVGIDVDRVAAAVATDRLTAWSGGVAPRIVVADAFAVDERWDFVVGNPPFVDGVHARFLELAARRAGRVAMVLPVSVLATREGRRARDAVARAGMGVSSVTPLGAVFDAAVETCVVVLEPGAPVPTGPTWSSLLASHVPVCELGSDGGVLGDRCETIAGFRQHFYGLRGHVGEGGDGLPLVTSGAIEPGVWGGRTIRFDGQRWDDPRVALDDVDEPVRSWFRALLRPKVVVATQTRVVEAAADPDGVVVPSVPVISVVPADPAELWHVLAVLLSPPVSAWAMRRWAGAALVADAVKLGCGQVREVPLPAACREWDRAAALVRSPAGVVEAGALMCRAYGVDEEVHAWWAARLR